ncbi:hypothetical protein A7K92_14310 [Klebsiella pneumoniae]|nr:hypothetical protein A7K92_14310 [Klebsiella pneumoniae]
MIFPKRGKFNVTDKGGLLDVGYFDFTVVRPHLVVACLLALGVIVGIVRAIGHDYFGSDPKRYRPQRRVGDLQSDLPAGGDCRGARKRGRCEKPFVSMSIFRW